MQVTIPPRIVVRSTGTAGAPTAGSWNLDELCLDAGGDLWYCTAAGDFAAVTPTFSNITTGGAGTITSVFGRTGPAIVAAIGDYTAAQVTHAADTSTATTQTFTGEVVAPSLGASGITGTQAGRFVGICGGTTGPASGTFQAGDCVVDGNGVLWVCTTAGTIGSGCVFTDRVSGVVPNPATTVTGPDAYGASAVVGTATTYARADHDHGLPAAPTVPNPATTVTGPDAYGASAVVGTATTYARADHNHGLPAAPAAAGKNTIINGAMDIAQRGTSFSGSGTTTYGLDRWCFQSSGSNTTFAQSSSSPPTGFRYFQSVTETSTTSSTWYLAQSIETNNVIPLQGQVVTLSFQYKMPVNFTNPVTVALLYSTGTDANLLNAGSAVTITAGSNVNTSTGAITNESAWTTGTATFTVPSNATSLAVQFSSATDIVGTGQFDVTGVQLELGSTATTFSRAGGSIGGELELCQRYFWQTSKTGYLAYALGQATAVTTAIVPIAFPTTMRVVPTLATSTAVTFCQINANNSAALAVSNIVLTDVDVDNCTLTTTCATGLVAGNASQFESNGATSYLAFSAEL
jgi:hypothetical protein